MTRIMDLTTSKISDVPSSEGVGSAWFADSNTLVGPDIHKMSFVLFNIARNEWSDLVPGISTTNSWEVSPDGKFFYYTLGGTDRQLNRINLTTRKVEEIVELGGLQMAINPAGGNPIFAVHADGSLVFSRDISSQEIYALTIRWP